jgi:hypothetical protein
MRNQAAPYTLLMTSNIPEYNLRNVIKTIPFPNLDMLCSLLYDAAARGAQQHGPMHFWRCGREGREHDDGTHHSL